MFVAISPVQKSVKTEPKKDDSEDICILTLAPFTPNPKLFFNDISVGTVAVRKLIIKNPLNRDVELFITNNFPNECHVVFNWNKIVLRQNDETCLELNWTPQKVGSWRYVLTIEDCNRLKRDVPVAFKSVSPKKAKGVTTRKKLPSYKVKKTTSPVKSLKSGPIKEKSPTVPNITKTPHITVTPPFLLNNDKENCPFINSGSILEIDRRQTFITNRRRETYTVLSPVNNRQPKQHLNQLNKSADMVFEDSLDSIHSDKSPEKINITQISVTPNDMEKRLKSIAFTFTPTKTPQNVIIDFEPKQCSTTQKKTDFNLEFQNDRIALFTEQNNMCSLSPGVLNISSETYIKGNLSSETFVKGNISSSTYVKDNSIGDCATLLQSPEINNFKSSSQQSRGSVHLQNLSGSGAMGVIQANLWSESNGVKPLCAIKEETFNDNNNISFTRNALKRKSTTSFLVTSPKRANIHRERLRDWSKRGSMAGLRISRKSSGLICDTTGENLVDIVKKDINEVIIKNPFLLAATDNVDPFMTASLHCDEVWIAEQENSFKKWLNALLAPPAELNSNKESHPLDVAKLWRECKKKEVALAPTREMVSIAYLTHGRLNSLRRNAIALFRSQEISTILIKVNTAIDSQKLMIRKDRDVHLDLGLQADITSILLSYNPLWLRIGLETIYNTIIPLHSNSDVMGLSTFIMGRFFKDPILLRKYKTIHSPKYKDDIKQFILKKFFMLIYFLDQAKIRKLIAHDPCLFCKNAPIKESREALLKFAKETLSAVGDITKYLKYFGYIVQHKQTYIHEFDYGVNCLGVDLRDGVRLTRIMELILLKDNLTSKLRVPAISRLQKIHNMKIVFESLKQAGFKILYEIDPKDIVDGHKEKTLSFLWQIIHKFQAPLMVKSAITIQKWWRSPRIVEKREKLLKIYKEKNEAARKIQLWYRQIKFAAKLEYLARSMKLYRENRRQHKAATKIQATFRMYTCKMEYKRTLSAIIKIQYYIRKWLLNKNYREKIKATVRIQSYIKMLLARKKFLKIKWATITIQQHYQNYRLQQKDFNNYIQMRKAIIIIQRRFRANQERKKYQSNYLQIKSSTITIQRWFRATQLSKIEREKFLTLKSSTLIIQQYYRAYRLMKTQRNSYLTIQKTIINLQRRYRAQIAMKQMRDQFLALKASAIIIQHHFRALKEMQHCRNDYLTLKYSAIIIQRRYRALIAMRNQVKQFKQIKEAVILIQTKYKAYMKMRKEMLIFNTLKNSVVKIQRRYRAKLEMRQQFNNYNKLKSAVTTIQNHFRAQKKMIEDRNKFNQLKHAVVVLQTRYRARLAMKLAVNRFQQTKQATVSIQRYYRAILEMRRKRIEFLKYKLACITIQRYYRARIAMKNESSNYKAIKQATIIIQRRFRAQLAMQQELACYTAKKKAAVIIQTWFRSIQYMKIQYKQYNELRRVTLMIQQRYRAKRAMQIATQKFIEIKQASICIQRQYRALYAMRLYRQRYLDLQKATKTIQLYYRAKQAMRRDLSEFKCKKQAIILIQRRLRAQLIMKQQKAIYNQWKRAAIIIQQRLRATLLMRIEHGKFIRMKDAAIVIQNKWRAFLMMRQAVHSFTTMKNAAICIQQHYRAIASMRRDQQHYLNLRRATCIIQQYYRARQAMIKQKSEFNRLKMAAIIIQTRFRAYKAMKIQHSQYLRMKQATIKIQCYFKAVQAMKKQRKIFIDIKNAAICIQRKYRANNSMKIAFKEFLIVRQAILRIQHKYRATVAMRRQKQNFLHLKQTVLFVQTTYRAKRMMRTEVKNYQNLKNATIIIQQRFRANLEMKRQRTKFIHLKEATLVIQQYFRLRQVMQLQKENYQKLKNATILIQRLYRANRAMRNDVAQYNQQRNSAIVIQNHFRAFVAMKSERHTFLMLKNATCTIQLLYRAKLMMRKNYRSYQRLRSAAILIQRQWRATIAMKKQLHDYNQLKKASIVIQKYFRATQAMKIEQNKFIKLRSVTVNIQRRYRANVEMRKQVERFKQYKNAVIIIQNWLRATTAMQKAKHDFQLLQTAVLMIQKRYRANRAMKKDLKDFQSLKKATIVLQQRYRALVKMREDKQRYIQLRNAVIVIQRRYRDKKAAHEELINRKKVETIVTLQQYIKGFLLRKQYAHELSEDGRRQRRRYKLEVKSATVIQSAWKGYRVRAVENPKLKLIRQRFVTANNNALPENTLGHKCKQALQSLGCEHTTLFQIIRAFEDIDFITRRCKNTCIRMSTILSDHLYKIMSSTSRSLPEMQACTAATYILINFAKYPPSRSNSWVPAHLDKVIMLMLHWCDKEAPLFPALCTLLWLFAQTDEYRKRMLSIPDFQQKVLRIQTMVVRKQKMVKKVGVRGMSVFSQHETSLLPSTVPDWGLEIKNKPRLFANSVYAFKCFMDAIQK